jgi:hypothetical protein
MARLKKLQREIKVTDGRLDGPAARWLREEGERKNITSRPPINYAEEKKTFSKQAKFSLFCVFVSCAISCALGFGDVLNIFAGNTL